MNNQNSLATLCAALCEVLGVEPPYEAAAANQKLVAYTKETLGKKKADRIFMYNPDAIARWVYEKYSHLFAEVKARTELELPLCSVVPPVTPVCFGTMYTGAQPAVHGIQAYVKPVITIDTIFDALLRSAKKPAIVSTAGDSLSLIYLERKMDYFIYNTVEEVNAKAAKLIIEDEYDFIVVYNANYDSAMHKYGPESHEALGELRANSRTFGMFDALIQEHWTSHNSLVGFAMDHGCHNVVGGCTPEERALFKEPTEDLVRILDEAKGFHGLETEEDLDIVHFYKVYKAQE